MDWLRHSTILSLLFTAGCASISGADRQLLLSASQDYQRGKHSTASHSLDAFLSKHPNAPESAEAYYLRGLCRAQQDRPGPALADLQNGLRLSRRPDLTARIHAAAGSLHFDAGAYAQAAYHFASWRRSLPKDERLGEEILYRHAASLQRDGRWDEARDRFDELLKLYPAGPRSADARRRRDWSSDAYSIQCGAFSRKASALTLVKRLKDAGFDARLTPEPRGEVSLQMVLVGRYPEYGDACAALPLVQTVAPDAIVVP